MQQPRRPKPNRPPDPVVEARTRGQFVANAVPDGEHRRRRRPWTSSSL